MALKLREMTSDEQSAIKRLARSRTASARQVERARIIEMAGSSERVPAIAARLEVAAKRPSGHGSSGSMPAAWTD